MHDEASPLYTEMVDQTTRVSRHDIVDIWVAFFSRSSDIVAGRATNFW